MKSQTVAAVTVAGDVGDLGAAHPAKYAACTPLPLRQYWDGPESMPTEGGVAFVGVADSGLSFYVRLEDSDIFSRATADSQKMWTLGDVAEFFVKAGTERPDYWEIHVTPNNFILDLHIANRQKFLDGEITWDEVTAPHSHAVRQVALVDGAWAVDVSIPWQAFDLSSRPAPGVAWQFAVCRYNYNGDLDDPEHSSTAELSDLDYHAYEGYTDLVF